MSWTKLDDLWSEQIEARIEDDYATRWHYLAMIQLCSRLETRDGVLSRSKAERCSDHPDPQAAITQLAEAGLVVHLGNKVKVIHAAEHVISEAKAEETKRKREDQRRSRAHREGDHEYCVPGTGDRPKDCRHASQSIGDVTGDTGTEEQQHSGEVAEGRSAGSGDTTVTVTGDVGTGRDGTGRDIEDPEVSSEEVDLQTGELLQNDLENDHGVDPKKVSDARVSNATSDWWDQKIAAAGDDIEKLTKVGKALAAEYPEDPRLSELRRRVSGPAKPASQEHDYTPEIFQKLREMRAA